MVMWLSAGDGYAPTPVVCTIIHIYLSDNVVAAILVIYLCSSWRVLGDLCGSIS